MKQIARPELVSGGLVFFEANTPDSSQASNYDDSASKNQNGARDGFNRFQILRW